MNPLLPGHSGTTPEPSRNALNTSQRTNEDNSQNDPRPEAGLFHGQMTQNSGPEDINSAKFHEDPSSQEKELLQKSCKILAINTTFAKFLEQIHILQGWWIWKYSCKILGIILQHFHTSCKNFARVVYLESCKILQEINYLYTHYVLIIYAFHQKASIINCWS